MLKSNKIKKIFIKLNLQKTFDKRLKKEYNWRIWRLEYE